MQLMAARETEAQLRRRPSRSAWPPAPTRLVSFSTIANRRLSSISRSQDHEDVYHVSVHAELMLATARRFTEAASDRLNMRLACSDALTSRQALNRDPSDDLALVSCSDSLGVQPLRAAQPHILRSHDSFNAS